jgi:tetratricopeptide (TPR) repeat protein
MRKSGLTLTPALLSPLALAAVLVLGPPGAASAGTAPPPAERARALEEVGRFAEAARLYEAALKEGKAPALLYRLALCKRHLGDYAGAREALRGYLREEPGGPLRVEVERQLAQLQVLIEERGLHPERAPHGAGKKAAGGPGPAPESIPAPGSAPAASSAAAVDPAPGPVSAPESSAAPLPASVPAPVSAPAPSAAPALDAAPAPASRSPSPTGPAAAPAPLAVAAPAAPPPAPRDPPALQAAPSSALAPAAAPSALRSALPFAAGAAVAGLAGTLLLWDGARVSSDLDARFASGDLTAADQPRYARAHREGAAGVALVSLAVLAAGAAVWVVAF